MSGACAGSRRVRAPFQADEPTPLVLSGLSSGLGLKRPILRLRVPCTTSRRRLRESRPTSGAVLGETDESCPDSSERSVASQFTSQERRRRHHSRVPGCRSASEEPTLRCLGVQAGGDDAWKPYRGKHFRGKIEIKRLNSVAAATLWKSWSLPREVWEACQKYPRSCGRDPQVSALNRADLRRHRKIQAAHGHSWAAQAES